MSSWPVENWAQDKLVSRTRARADQGALNLAPSQEGTSYQGSMAGTRDDDAASTRVSMYSYRSDTGNSRFVKEVDGRVSLLFLMIWTLLTILKDNQCSE
jgi:hypothetical protein